MALHNEFGAWGEDVAADYLIGKGYAIVDRNVRFGRNELDIVAMHAGRIVFVEVKTRRDDSFDPTVGITRAKMLHLSRAANSYVRAYDIPHEVQFDVILITGTPETGAHVDHYPDAFFPPLTGYY